jgi:hypothetical protein
MRAVSDGTGPELHLRDGAQVLGAAGILLDHRHRDDGRLSRENTNTNTNTKYTCDTDENGSPRGLSVLPQTSSLTLAIAPQKAASTMM